MRIHKIVTSKKLIYPLERVVEYKPHKRFPWLSDFLFNCLVKLKSLKWYVNTTSVESFDYTDFHEDEISKMLDYFRMRGISRFGNPSKFVLVMDSKRFHDVTNFIVSNETLVYLNTFNVQNEYGVTRYKDMQCLICPDMEGIGIVPKKYVEKS